jgi:hypothetical protein
MARSRRESHHNDGITDPARLQQTSATKSAKSGLMLNTRCPTGNGKQTKKADPRSFTFFLCAHRERPRRSTAEHSDELTPLHGLPSHQGPDPSTTTNVLCIAAMSRLAHHG